MVASIKDSTDAMDSLQPVGIAPQLLDAEYSGYTCILPTGIAAGRIRHRQEIFLPTLFYSLFSKPLLPVQGVVVEHSRELLRAAGEQPYPSSTRPPKRFVRTHAEDVVQTW